MTIQGWMQNVTQVSK